MGNHAHILTIPEKETSLARGIGGTNLLYAQYIHRKVNIIEAEGYGKTDSFPQ